MYRKVRLESSLAAALLGKKRIQGKEAVSADSGWAVK